LFDSSGPGAYAAGYAAKLAEAILSVDQSALARAVEYVEQAAENGAHVYAIGNGGSAAIADHLCCDWTKGTHVKTKPTLVCTSLTSNVALYSAIANDYGFEQVFTTQVEFFAKQNDILIAISSSGNSPNIVQAVELAKTKGAKTIGLSGFSGGKLAQASDVSLFVKANNYGIVEDAHQALMHIIAQYIAGRRDKA
jgi:phosphoheptose isomerase